MIETSSVLRNARGLPCTLLAFGALLSSCSDDAGLVVRISLTPSRVNVTSPLTMTVIAENASSRRVTWGQGSSTCQLRAVVRVGQASREVVARRFCTADLIEQGLDPGETISESWEWGAEVQGSMEVDTLAPGTYLVRGAAGMAAFSEQQSVMVEPTGD